MDASDAARVLAHRWRPLYSRKLVYAQTTVGRKTVLLHRFILPVPDGKQVDHRDHNTLNCRRSNLRIATARQNVANRPPRRQGFKGVVRIGSGFRARIWRDGKRVSLGTFVDELSAAKVYDAAAREIYGEFAYPSF